MYEIILSKNFTKQFYKLPKPIQQRIRKILEKLKFDPIGLALRADLFGFYSVHFENNKYRLIYFKDKTKLQILVLYVGKRTDDIYDDFKNDINLIKKSDE